MQKTISVKMLAVFMSIVLAVGCVVGGTVAWLIAQTENVVNTFTFGDINIVLDETKLNSDGERVDEDGNILPDDADPVKTTVGNEYKIVPGMEYSKDPAVTVVKGSEKCWLFVELTESGTSIVVKDQVTMNYGFGDFLEYSVITGENNSEWKPLLIEEDGTKVYYRIVEAKPDEDQIFDVIQYDDGTNVFVNTIKVKDSVTKEMIDGIPDEESYPRLTLRAYAVQYSGFEPIPTGENGTVTDSDEKTAALSAWNAAASQ